MERINASKASRDELNRLRGLRETEVPYPMGIDTDIYPDAKSVKESLGSSNDPRFPKVVGRTKPE